MSEEEGRAGVVEVVDGEVGWEVMRGAEWAVGVAVMVNMERGTVVVMGGGVDIFGSLSSNRRW